MSQRILFLDIDGVLNSAAWFAKMQCDALSREPISNMIDPACVARVNRILDASGARVVVSSSWRIIRILGEINAALKEKGFTGKIIGKTPQGLRCRGEEIQRWLTDHGHSPDHALILDDDSDMAHLTPCLVRTSWSCGITDADVARALAVFGIASSEVSNA